MNKLVLLGVAFVVFIFAFYNLAPEFIQTWTINQPSPTTITQPSPTFGQRTQMSGCVSVKGLPDKECTPGEIDPKVTQDNIHQTICVSGYTKTVRPSGSYTDKLKLKLMKEYGYTDSKSNYELDHLIPLQLGGHPTSEANLWPESYNTTLNARDKNEAGDYLRKQVCEGNITLLQAQLQIANDWVSVYQKLSR